MLEFVPLPMQFLDNPLLRWGYIAGTILLALLLKKFVSRYLAAFIYRLLRRFWGNVEQSYFTDLVVQPLELFLLVVVTIFSIDKLTFPTVLEYTVYGITTSAVFQKLGIAIIILAFTWLLLRLIDFIALVLERKADRTKDQGDNQLIVFFKDFFKVFLVIGGFLALLKFCFGQAIGPLITGLGIAGAAIALASKESLENIIASFVIFFDKPFITGDMLKVQDITGTVERIGLRSTRIRTLDKTLVSVPNKQMVDSIVDNHTMRTGLKGELKLLLAPHTTATTAAALVQQIDTILQNQNEQLESFAVSVKDISKDGLLIKAIYFCPSIPAEVFEGLQETITLAVKKKLEEGQFEFAAMGISHP